MRVKTVSNHALAGENIRDFFERFGSLLPLVNLLDRRNYGKLLGLGRFASAKSILDIGAGAGFLAALALRDHLPADAKCTLVDVSAELVRRLERRFGRFQHRVSIYQVPLDPPYPFGDVRFDRVVCTHVLDMLTSEHAARIIAEAHRVLDAGGLFCTLSCDHSRSSFSKCVGAIHSFLYRRDPRLVGFSRPIDITSLLSPQKWRTLFDQQVENWGFRTRILVTAKK